MNAANRLLIFALIGLLLGSIGGGYLGSYFAHRTVCKQVANDPYLSDLRKTQFC